MSTRKGRGLGKALMLGWMGMFRERVSLGGPAVCRTPQSQVAKHGTASEQSQPPGTAAVWQGAGTTRLTHTNSKQGRPHRRSPAHSLAEVHGAGGMSPPTPPRGRPARQGCHRASRARGLDLGVQGGLAHQQLRSPSLRTVLRQGPLSHTDPTWRETGGSDRRRAGALLPSGGSAGPGPGKGVGMDH